MGLSFGGPIALFGGYAYGTARRRVQRRSAAEQGEVVNRLKEQVSESEGRRRAQLQDQLRGEEDWHYLASREQLFYAWRRCCWP